MVAYKAAHTMTERLAEGCLSAISPCAHQRRDPGSICETCEASHDNYRRKMIEQAVRDAKRLLESKGYLVIKRVSHGEQ